MPPDPPRRLQLINFPHTNIHPLQKKSCMKPWYAMTCHVRTLIGGGNHKYKLEQTPLQYEA